MRPPFSLSIASRTERRLVGPFLLLLLTAAPVLGASSRALDATPELVAPADVGMSEAVLRSGITLFEEALARDDLKGVVLLVARDGKVVLHEALGWRNQEQKLPMERDTLFRMASNTKPVVATAVLMLAEEKKLRLDANVREYLPGWDNARSAFVQVRHLLSHTGGLRIPTLFLEPLMSPSAEHPDAPSLVLEAARFGEVGPEYPPGTTFSYSNPGFNTLGALVETTSGMPLAAFLRERIYQPLGMVDSYNHEPDAPNDRMARVYRRGNHAAWTVQWTPGDPPDVPFVRASGGMISTAADYVRFLELWRRGGELGGVRLLSSDGVKEATRSQTADARGGSEGEDGYGYGWFVEPDGIFSHGGSDGTWAWVDPRRNLVGLVFTQSPGGRIPREQFRRVVEAACYDP